MSKKTVVFDFDGVIHNYTGEWEGADVISGSLVSGIDRALKAIHDAGYEVVVVSSRCAVTEGLEALKAWFRKQGIYGYIDRVSPVKPPAIVYIDDRAIRFNGNPDGLLEQINSFHPWWEEQEKMKLFISIPQNGRTDEDVEIEKDQIRRWAEHGADPSPVELIDTYIHEDAPVDGDRAGAWYLGESLKRLATADLVVFATGWNQARGCMIEKAVCEAYNIPYTILEHQAKEV